MAAQPLPSLSTARSSDPAETRGPRTSSSPTSPTTSGPAAGARRADRQGRVVQSIAHKVTRPCSRNGCPAPARTSMALDYAGKRVTLVPLLDERDPRFLEVCPTHAEAMDVPRGWDLIDERGEEAPAPTGPPSADEMGSSSTVAVLAAALRGDTDTPGAVADRPESSTDTPTAELVDDPVGPTRSPAPATPSAEADEAGEADTQQARTFDLPVKDFDVDAVPAEPATPVTPTPMPAVPRPPSGRTVEPLRRSSDVVDERQLLLADDADGATPTQRAARPVPAARTEDRLPPTHA